MIESVPSGTFVGEVVRLPDSVARAWLDELDEGGLREGEYVSIDQMTHMDGDYHDLVIFRSSHSYHLSVNPEE